MNTLRSYHSWPHVFEGMALTILGLSAIALPGLFTIGIEQFAGFLFIFSSLVQVFRIIKTHPSPALLSRSFIALLHFAIGFILVGFPLTGILSLTILVVFLFTLDGIAKMSIGFQLRPLTGWGWMVASAVASWLMVAIILSDWPDAAYWTLGLLCGVNLLLYGLSHLALCLSSYFESRSY